MFDALCEDSVLAPGDSQRRWLLYLPKHQPVVTGNGSIRCLLCRKCAYAFSKKDGTLGNGLASYMPHLCRARGLWGGPEPKEIADLTYAERHAIQLARLYVSVKRVFLNRGATGSRGSPKEVPRFYEKNVVAYPQDPEQ